MSTDETILMATIAHIHLNYVRRIAADRFFNLRTLCQAELNLYYGLRGFERSGCSHTVLTQAADCIDYIKS